MGTNYYWIDSPCSHCGRADTIHVGKSGTTFRAYFEPNSPFDFTIASVADWRKVFTERQGWLEDEYHRRIPDAVAWLDSYTPPTDVRRAQKQRWWSVDDLWDPEGYHFCTSEFC